MNYGLTMDELLHELTTNTTTSTPTTPMTHHTATSRAPRAPQQVPPVPAPASTAWTRKSVLSLRRIVIFYDMVNGIKFNGWLSLIQFSMKNCHFPWLN